MFFLKKTYNYQFSIAIIRPEFELIHSIFICLQLIFRRNKYEY